MKWICIVCDKELEDLCPVPPPPPEDRACFPNIEGGTMEVHFGYGSRFDDGLHPVKHHACICDDCWEKKKHLTRAVLEKRCTTWKILPPNYDEDPNWA